MPMALLLLSVGLSISMSACAKRPAPHAAHAAHAHGPSSTAACQPDASGSPGHCACMGGILRPTSGGASTGSCPQGETALGRVEQENALCCKALVE